ncbi:lysine transporter LysE [Pokkaliibacter plantistimulans]|uniref:Lysine transporter LysE n=1 Tax=Proteobacteria bacterium 228 TaxID=2083153 RepID=A0A2S5KTJ7_9PROT|nr:LysE family translocator [Pokkaliibacter plantistimulans]PPC78181.1 lysine transporter LysE [Pokkaliibacter plantistimulans]
MNGIWLAWAAYLLLIVSPGPSNMAIALLAMQRGRRQAAIFAAGVITGSFSWALLSAGGLANVLLEHDTLLLLLRYLGAAYLLWLSARATRSLWRGTDVASAPIMADAGWRLYGRGLLMHLTNPKAGFGWLAILTLALPSLTAPSQLLVVLLGCALLAIGVFGGYALLFSRPQAQAAYQCWRRSCDGALALVCGLAGIKLLLAR